MNFRARAVSRIHRQTRMHPDANACAQDPALPSVGPRTTAERAGPGAAWRIASRARSPTARCGCLLPESWLRSRRALELVAAVAAIVFQVSRPDSSRDRGAVAAVEELRQSVAARPRRTRRDNPTRRRNASLRGSPRRCRKRSSGRQGLRCCTALHRFRRCTPSRRCTSRPKVAVDRSRTPWPAARRTLPSPDPAAPAASHSARYRVEVHVRLGGGFDEEGAAHDRLEVASGRAHALRRLVHVLSGARQPSGPRAARSPSARCARIRARPRWSPCTRHTRGRACTSKAYA